MNDMSISVRCLGLLLLNALACIPIQSAERANPNIVVILADDLGWADTTLYGHTSLYETPMLSRQKRRQEVRNLFHHVKRANMASKKVPDCGDPFSVS